MKNHDYYLSHLRITLLTLFLCFSGSSIFAQLPCGQNIDLNTWSVEGEPTSGNWQVNAAGSSVDQGVNGTSTWFVSPIDYFNVLIQGSITVNTAVDDDLVGFVFGYQNPIGTLTNPSSTFLKSYFFDWKQSAQTFQTLFSDEGFALYEYNGNFDFTNITSTAGGAVFPSLWERTTTSEITVLDTDYANNGWNDNQTYNFQLKYTADSIVIWIDSVRIFEESGCFEPGRFGFYNHSQDDVTYSDFSYKHEYDFTVVDSVICVGDTGQFEIGAGCNNTIPTSITFNWDFGDGSTGTGIDPGHQYTNPGTYTVNMYSVDGFNCEDTAVQTITVLPYPTPNAGLDDIVCSSNYFLNATQSAYSGVWSGPPGASFGNINLPYSSVTTSSPGTYSFVWTETNSEGCSASDTVIIIMDTLTITVSTDTLICPGDTTILNAYGAQTYSWSPSTGLNSTTGSSVSASPSSTQTYIVTGTNANGCIDTDTVTVFVDTINVHVTGETDICKYDSVVLTATGAQSYTWSPTTWLNPAVGPVVTASPPQTQTYIVTGINANGCIDKDTITVVVDTTCCSALTDPLFVVAQNVNTDTYWTEKVYVPDNTIIVVDGAILDITNVDVVFGQCSGIDFINGAKLRSNNSVYRPCDMNDTWRGLRFEGQTNFEHQINESTFKNASIALMFEDDANAEINSNTFSNCNEGVTVFKSLFTETIFGNNFVTNNAYPNHKACETSASANDVIHIHCIGLSDDLAKSTMMITQNNFTMNNTSGSISATGIDMSNSQASITENTMTNMEDGIVIHDPRAETHIESNEIENNNLFRSVSGNLRQIFINQSHGVYVSINYNELRNSIFDAPFMSNGIYLERSDNVSIQSNVLDGFHYGINSRVATVVNISENVFTSITVAGIHFDEAGQQGTNFITCNDITMVMGRGYGISTFRVDRFTEITSNCIKDGKEAIHLVGNSNLPLIRNNYMYNYSTGISNSGHSGNIGTPTDPGMNTFYSNSAGVDVFTNTSITGANNFGLSIFSPLLQQTQTITTYSTASCGHQIYNSPSQSNLNTKYTCDNNEQFLQPKGKSNGSINLPSVNSAIAFLEGASNKMNVVRQFVYLEGCDMVYLTNVMNGIDLSEQDEDMILYTYHKFNDEYIAANSKLDLLVGTEYEHVVKVERLVLKNEATGQLTPGDFTLIASILNTPELNEEQYNLAVALSKTGSNHGMYRTSYPEISSEIGHDFVSITEDKTQLEIFPNPSTDEINVQIMEGKTVAGQELIIYDMYGSIVQTTQLDFISGREKVNISALSSGAYFVVLVSDGERSERTKFIKL